MGLEQPDISIFAKIAGAKTSPSAEENVPIKSRIIAFLTDWPNLVGMGVSALLIVLNIIYPIFQIGWLLVISTLAWLFCVVVIPSTPVRPTVKYAGGLQTNLVRSSLKDLVLAIAPKYKELPATQFQALREILSLLWDMSSDPSAFVANPSQANVVEQIASSWLPDALEMYFDVPMRSRDLTLASGESANQALEEQLQLLLSETKRLDAAIINDDLQELADHGRFLEEKFGNSSLDLS